MTDLVYHELKDTTIPEYLFIRDLPGGAGGRSCLLYTSSYHEVDSSEMAFHIAGSLAFKDAMKKASPVLLEPIMRVEVTMPEEYMGDVIGDINSRRGRIEGMDDLGGGKIVRGFVPLSEMFGYSTDLRSRTQAVSYTHLPPDKELHPDQSEIQRPVFPEMDEELQLLSFLPYQCSLMFPLHRYNCCLLYTSRTRIRR